MADLTSTIMDSKQNPIFTKIKNFSFDKPDTDFTFTQRLARENNWEIEYTQRVIEEYRKFIFLAVVAKHTVTPSDQIDQAWHLHLTYTRSYWDDFCPNVLGKSLHHEPTEGGKLEQAKYDDLYHKTLDSYTKYFGTQAPIDIWSSSDIRFGKDLFFKRINTQENWIIPKLDIISLVNNLKVKFNRTTTVITSFLLIIFITLGIALPGLAQNSPFYWDFIDVNLDIQDNGDILVTEEQKYVFPDLHSPQHYRFFKLNNNIRAIKDVQVFEDNQLLPIKTEIQNDEFWIKWQEHLDERDTHTFILKYRAIGAITDSYGADKLYWKAIFPKREALINNSEITIKLPELLAGKIRNYYNIGGNFKTSLVSDRLIKFTSLQPLLPGKSTIINATFLGNFLDLEKLNNTSHNLSSSHNSNSTSTIVLIVFIIWLGLVFVSVILTMFRVLTNKSKLKGTTGNDSGGYGGCGGCGGCSGCGGCGGGCGGGG